MDIEIIKLRPESQAERAALTALLDLGALLAEAPIDVAKTRVIGGHMVTLHGARAGLGRQHARLTKDADVGFDKLDVRRLDLIKRFEARGYGLTGGHRFVRPLESDGEEAIIDVLIPKYTSGLGKREKVAGMTLYQTPALATLLRRDPLMLEIQIDVGDGNVRSTTIATTDERGALYSKIAAWEDRRRKGDADKDAFDVWRCLEVCRWAGVRPDSWPDSFDDFDWKDVLRSNFGDRGDEGARALGRQLRAHGLGIDEGITRMTALVKAIVG